MRSYAILLQSLRRRWSRHEPSLQSKCRSSPAQRASESLTLKADEDPRCVMTIHQSIHNKTRLLALLQHRHTGFQHQLPMVSSLTITRPKLRHPKHSPATKTNILPLSLFAVETLSVLLKPHSTFNLLVFAPPSLSKQSLTSRYQRPCCHDRQWLAEVCLAERLACVEPHFSSLLALPCLSLNAQHTGSRWFEPCYVSDLLLLVLA